jgi:hypothetical protein
MAPNGAISFPASALAAQGIAGETDLLQLVALKVHGRCQNVKGLFGSEGSSQ